MYKRAYIRVIIYSTSPDPPSTHSGLGASVSSGAHLSLGESQLGRQVGPLGQGQVLGLLEALVQGLQLQAGVDGSGLPYFFPFAI